MKALHNTSQAGGVSNRGWGMARLQRRNSLTWAYSDPNAVFPYPRWFKSGGGECSFKWGGGLDNKDLIIFIAKFRSVTPGDNTFIKYFFKDFFSKIYPLFVQDEQNGFGSKILKSFVSSSFFP